MYLIDSSVWIDGINGKAKTVKFLRQLSPEALGINLLIYTEVLQGASTQKLLNVQQSYLSAQPFYGFQNDKISHQQAANIYRKCRQNGVTPRSTIDCLIAQCAIENDLILLHNDKDFVKIASVMPNLQQTAI
ncbi:MAG: PIN domain nuclease [Methylococcales symbiont of Hymedesmia sp. n. MRB-2018]|nr:MAG: PIN domain nuclease [Methylococcales symbiont of Hymedesmia sp. n. MRB-2018]